MPISTTIIRAIQAFAFNKNSISDFSKSLYNTTITFTWTGSFSFTWVETPHYFLSQQDAMISLPLTYFF